MASFVRGRGTEGPLFADISSKEAICVSEEIKLWYLVQSVRSFSCEASQCGLCTVWVQS